MCFFLQLDPAGIQGSPTYTFSCLCAVPKPKDYKWAPGGGDVYLTGETGRFRERSMQPGRKGAEIRAVWPCRLCEMVFLSFFFFIFTLFYFTMLYWFCHTLTWIHHECTCIPKHEPLSRLPPHNISLGHPRAPAPSMLYPALDIDWRFNSFMIVYMFQCHSPKSSHPLLLPQSPKVCSTHLCLFCCLAYRVIITIFLNSIYMC